MYNRGSVCKHCVLDNTSCIIDFDPQGICNYCNAYFDRQKNGPSLDNKKFILKDLVADIKKQGKSKKFDCLIGLSGGIDSSYLAYLAVRTLGLRPLAVHFDNGWNTELAIENINRIIDGLHLELLTYVIDWEEFKDLQLAYMKASVVDMEVPTDHFIFATMYKYAHENGIKNILNGWNSMTESIMPTGWNSSKDDLANLLDIHKQYGTKKLTKFPKLGLKQRLYYCHFAKIKQVYPLDLLDYKISEAKETLSEKLGWRDYGGKHYESTWTRFYQGYILPKKFNIDKRKAHFSNLICSGQMTRDKALLILQEDPYPKRLQEEDKEFVMNKLGLSKHEFQEFIEAPGREHNEFDTEIHKVQKWTLFCTRLETLLFYAIRPVELLKFIKYKVYLAFNSR